VSRYARNTVDTLSYVRQLVAKGVGITFMNDNICTSQPDYELRLTIMASFAQEESRKTSERVKWGIQQKMRGGHVFGNRMLGYKLVKGVLEAVPDEIELVKRIFNLYVYEGKSFLAIARQLNDENIATIKGNTWSASTVSQTIKNSKYVGDLTQMRRTTPNYLTGLTVQNSKDNHIHISNHHEGVISREVWEAAQAEIAERGALTKEGQKYSKKNWYSNKIFCGKCGWSFSPGGAPKHKMGKRSLKCRNRLFNTTEIRSAVNGKQIGCDNTSINEKALPQFMKFILEHIQTSRDEIIKDMLDEIKLMQQADEPIDTKQLEAEIENNLKKKRKAYDLMLDDMLSKDDLLAQSAFYDNEIARLTEEINQSHNLISVHQKQIDKVKAYIAEVNKAAKTDTDSTDIYRELLDRVIVNDGNAVIYLKCMPVGFKIFYHTKRVNTRRIFNIIIDNYEIVS
jgi:predicted small metal-binding protein/transposase